MAMFYLDVMTWLVDCFCLWLCFYLWNDMVS